MRSCGMGLVAVLATILTLALNRAGVEAADCTGSVTPDTSAGTTDDYGWRDEVEIVMTKDMSVVTEGYTLVHVSGEPNKDKSGYAGLHDGNSAFGVITGTTTRPDWKYYLEEWVVGHVWTANHYVHLPTTYLAICHAEVQFDTSITSPVDIEQDCQVVKESDGEEWCEAVRKPDAETLVENQTTFGITYRIHPYSFAGTNRPELEIYSEADEQWATGYLKAWDNYSGSPNTQIGETIWLD